MLWRLFVKNAILISALLLLFFFSIAYGFDVSFQWDESLVGDVAGYKIHYGFSSRSYEFIVDVGYLNTFTLYGLDDGQVHYFALTAYNSEGLESDFSAELIFPPDTACNVDLDNDFDIDGNDLSTLAAAFLTGGADLSDLEAFAADFGKVGCE